MTREPCVLGSTLCRSPPARTINADASVVRADSTDDTTTTIDDYSP